MFADSIRSQFNNAPVGFEPEDQLKPLVSDFLKSVTALAGHTANTWTEVSSDDAVGRPDIGVSVESLLAGFVELKRPGKGADPTAFRGADRSQWERFRDLPNLIYTDGSDWALFRNGEVISSFSAARDLTRFGAAGLEHASITGWESLLTDFLAWQPIVPSTPRALGQMLARLCRLLRDNVAECLDNPSTQVAHLSADWKRFFFPEGDNRQFADAYAQTVTYALLLARLSGATSLTLDSAVPQIRPGHSLLADALRLLGDPSVKTELQTPLRLLERTIGAVDPIRLAKSSRGDPWLYFYEDFLAEYDSELRKNRGVYYTPVEVVKAQINLVGEVLQDRFDKPLAFADPSVFTLDPAVGTGTFPLSAIEYSLRLAEKAKGKGIRASAATTAANNIYGFELLVGPYAVAHLRITQAVLAQGGSVPVDGIHIYLTDTLESPLTTPPDHLPMAYRALGDEHMRARKVKNDIDILVCVGNPPYDRQTIEYGASVSRKGGWVRYGTGHSDSDGILQDFVRPLTAAGLGLHAKNLYNDYVYFIRWALWKVLESKAGPGVISLITASSYLAGQGFSGMRELMRRLFDEIWIIDLEGESHGARPSENVFNIRTGVAIFMGVRYQAIASETPARVHFTRITGSQEDKLKRLGRVENLADLTWKPCSDEWSSPFLPLPSAIYSAWPSVFELFPWQENGVQFKRSWPIGETTELLENRWEQIVTKKDPADFRETADRSLDRACSDICDDAKVLPPIKRLAVTDKAPGLSRYAFRSFDRRYALLDPRLADRLRPNLLRSHSDSQLYLTSIWTKVLGAGPAAIVTNLIPDMDHFCNRGAKDVIPLWRDAECMSPNITCGMLGMLEGGYGHPITPEDFFCYCYAVLSSPLYVEMFWDELEQPPPRLPITTDCQLFGRAVELGRKLVYLHTFGERKLPGGKGRYASIGGSARCEVATPTSAADYPNDVSYDANAKTLTVGSGVFGNVAPEVANFRISGFPVLESWVKYRLKNRKGRSSSRLDDIRPYRWSFDDELLKVIWVLENTLDTYAIANELLKEICSSACFTSDVLPKPQPWETDRITERLVQSNEPRLF